MLIHLPTGTERGAARLWAPTVQSSGVVGGWGLPGLFHTD